MSQYSQRGGILLLTLLIMGVFLVIMIAGSGLIRYLSHYTTSQEPTEHAFAAADAGINYGAWLLNSGMKTPSTLQPITRTITDPTNEPVGIFDLSFTAGKVTSTERVILAAIGLFKLSFRPPSFSSPDRVIITSIGKDYNDQNVCQIIVAIVRESIPGGGPGTYTMTRWDHQLSTTTCSLPSAPPINPDLP